jgi:5-methylcytosine-specific restriction enzyme A
MTTPFQVGEQYRRRDLHEKYGGQEQGGIATPSQHPFIMLFTAETGEQYGYRDGWSSEKLFLYTGEGQKGDMQFVRGNRAIRDHLQDGKDLYMFKYVKQGHVEYIGQMVYVGHQTRKGPDVSGEMRDLIVFELQAVED